MNRRSILSLLAAAVFGLALAAEFRHCPDQDTQGTASGHLDARLIRQLRCQRRQGTEYGGERPQGAGYLY